MTTLFIIILVVDIIIQAVIAYAKRETFNKTVSLKEDAETQCRIYQDSIDAKVKQIEVLNKQNKELNNFNINITKDRNDYKDKMLKTELDLKVVKAHNLLTNLNKFVVCSAFKKLLDSDMHFTYLFNEEAKSYFVEFIRFNTQTSKIELGVKPTKDSKAAVKYVDSFVLNEVALPTQETEPKAKLKSKKVSK